VNGAEVYHDNEDSVEAKKVLVADRIPGSGGLRLCHFCRELRIEQSGPKLGG